MKVVLYIHHIKLTKIFAGGSWSAPQVNSLVQRLLRVKIPGLPCMVLMHPAHCVVGGVAGLWLQGCIIITVHASLPHSLPRMVNRKAVLLPLSFHTSFTDQDHRAASI